jgi:hypothetical protein
VSIPPILYPLLSALPGCTPSGVVLGPDTPAETASAADTAPDVLPDAPDTGGADTGTPGMPGAPGLATLTCPSAPSTVGKVTCSLDITGPDGTVQWSGPAGIGLHGRSSAGFPKPQFSVELRDDAGADAAADLFGMGAEADWILNGMYIDRVLFRNKLGFDLYRTLTSGHDWAPRSTYVELTYQGQYAGVFQLEERVDHGPGRTPVPDDDGTGTSFIVRADETGIPSSLQYGAWDVVYPSDAAQTPAVTAAVTARLGRMETAIAAHDATTWNEVDLDSAVAFVLLEELVKNNDAFYLSHHLYTGEDGKIRFVPWDLDLTLGQPDYNDNENPASWILYRPAIIVGLGAAPGFQARMTTMWAEWRAGALADTAVDTRIAALEALLGDAPARNFAVWPIGDIQFGGSYLYPVTSYADELSHVTTWVHARLNWMDTNVAAWSSGP